MHNCPPIGGEGVQAWAKVKATEWESALGEKPTNRPSQPRAIRDATTPDAALFHVCSVGMWPRGGGWDDVEQTSITSWLEKLDEV